VRSRRSGSQDGKRLVRNERKDDPAGANLKLKRAREIKVPEGGQGTFEEGGGNLEGKDVGKSPTASTCNLAQGEGIRRRTSFYEQSRKKTGGKREARSPSLEG